MKVDTLSMLIQTLASKAACATANFLEKKFKSKDFVMHEILEGFKLAEGSAESCRLLNIDVGRYIPFPACTCKDLEKQLSSVVVLYNEDCTATELNNIYIQVNMVFEKRKKPKTKIDKKDNTIYRNNKGEE